MKLVELNFYESVGIFEITVRAEGKSSNFLIKYLATVWKRSEDGYTCERSEGGGGGCRTWRRCRSAGTAGVSVSG